MNAKSPRRGRAPKSEEARDTPRSPPSDALPPTPERRFPSRESQKAQTRQRLIEAAAQCFAEKGFDQTTPNDIAIAAQTTRSTFYLHFKSTAELALCVGRTAAEQSIALIQELDLQPAPNTDSILAWLHKVISHYLSQVPIVTALNRALASAPEWESHYADFAELYPRGMTRYLSRYTGADRDEAHRRLLVLYMMVERFLYFEVLVRTPLNRTGMDRTVAEGIYRLLYAGRPEHSAKAGGSAASRAGR